MPEYSRSLRTRGIFAIGLYGFDFRDFREFHEDKVGNFSKYLTICIVRMILLLSSMSVDVWPFKAVIRMLPCCFMLFRV